MSVSVNPTILIKDACILFDLLDLELLADFYRLHVTVITTPEVISEIEDPEQLEQIQPYIDSGQLQVDRNGVLANMILITDGNPGLSLTDASVLEAATRLQAMILSSDGSLRRVSQQKGITVRGMLWVLEELYRKEILTKELVLEKLVRYPQVNVRAPQIETEHLIIKIKQVTS